MKYIKRIEEAWQNKYNRVVIDTHKNTLFTFQSIRVMHDDVKEEDIFHFYDNLKVKEEYKKYLLKNKLKVVVDMLEYIAKKHSSMLMEIGDLRYDKFTSPIVIYLPGGKKVNMPMDVLEASKVFHDGTSEEYLYMCSGDKNPVESEFFHWDNGTIDGIQKIFDKGSDVEKINLYTSWYWNSYGDDDDSFMSAAFKKNIKFIENMHNKAYMKEFNMMNKLGNEFGFFEK